MIIQNIPVYFTDGMKESNSLISRLECCAADRYSRYGTIHKKLTDPAIHQMSFASADQQKILTMNNPHKTIDLSGHTVYLFPLYGMTVDEITPDDIETARQILWQRPMYVNDDGDGNPWIEY